MPLLRLPKAINYKCLDLLVGSAISSSSKETKTFRQNWFHHSKGTSSQFSLNFSFDVCSKYIYSKTWLLSSLSSQATPTASFDINQ